MASDPSYEQSKQIAEASRETEWTRPSFGKELFLGNFRLDLIHPQPPLDPAQVRAGEAFLGCRHYPQCRYTAPLPPETVG